MLIFRFIHLFWITAWVNLNDLMLKNKSGFSFCPVLHLYLPPRSEMLCFSSCLFKAHPPSVVCCDWSAHTRLSQHRSPCLWSTACGFSPPVGLTVTVKIGINHANMCHSDVTMSWNWRRACWWGVSEAVFSVGERSFCGCGLGFLTFKTFTCTKTWRKIWRSKKKKLNWSPLT